MPPADHAFAEEQTNGAEPADSTTTFDVSISTTR